MHIVQELRLPLELGALLASDVWRGNGIRRGAGQPVLTIPGLFVGDDTTRVLRTWLRRVGYAPLQSGVRSNTLCSERTVSQIAGRLERAVWSARQPVHLIGQSRGGMLAHVLAVRHPELVASVTTLGSPLRGSADDLHPLLRGNIALLSRLGDAAGSLISSSCWIGAPGEPRAADDADACCRDFWASLAEPLPAGIAGTAVYSRTDGLVSPGTCFAPGYQPFEVAASHIGMAAHPAVYRTIAATLERSGRQLRTADSTPVALPSGRPLIDRRRRHRRAA